MNELTTPRLYEAVFFEASLNRLRGNRFFGIQTVSESSLVHTKHIKFRSRFRDTAERGAYQPQDNEGRSGEVIDLGASYEELSKMLLRLPPRVLQSFRLVKSHYSAIEHLPKQLAGRWVLVSLLRY